jgi:amino acid transporter
MVYDAVYLLHPAHGLNWGALAPTELFRPGVGAILAIAVLGFVGFESAVVFSEESRRPKRTIPLATYSAVVLIAALYGVSSWAMAQAAGSDQIVAQSQEQNVDLLFNLAAVHMGSGSATLGHILFVTSIIAAMISFHNTTARYVFALGREGVLPNIFGSTSGSGAPRSGSVTQSILGLVVIIVYAAAGWDPVLQLFYIASTSGALGILLLVFIAAIAVVFFFARDRRGESVWHTLVAPLLSAILIAVMLVMVVANVAGLLGVEESSPLRWGVPGSFVVTALGGIIYGTLLRTRRPHIYAAIGLGAKAAAVTRPTTPIFAESPSHDDVMPSHSEG